MAKNEEENTGYITQSTRHSMLVSLSREINVISDENAVLYDTIIELCKKFFPEKNNQKFCAQCKIMEKGAYAPNPIDDPTTPYIESHILRLEMLATGNMELKDQIVKMCRLLLEEKDNDKGNDRSKTLFTIFDTPENAPFATPSSKRADLNFAGAADRLLTGQMKRRVKIMKKGTTVESGYDAEGRWHLKLRKAKGKFTLDEIIEAAKEWEEDYYAVIIKAMSDETAQYYDDDLEGDYVTLYRATDFISKEV